MKNETIIVILNEMHDKLAGTLKRTDLSETKREILMGRKRGLLKRIANLSMTDEKLSELINSKV